MNMSKKNVPKGHFFIVDSNVDKGEEPNIIDIGPEFECVVLRSSKKMSAFDGENGKSLAETTEFSDFQSEPIFVIDNAGERPVIVTVAPYGVIKQMKYEPTKEELKAYRDSGGAAGKTLHPLHPVVKELKLQYLAYVLYQAPGEEAPSLYSMKLGARGWLGMNAQGEACKYGEEAPTSFIKAQSLCHKQYPRTTHMHLWRMFSTSFTTNGDKDDDGNSVKDYYPSFEIKGEWKDDMLEPVEQGRELLKQHLFSMYGRRIGFAWKNTSDREFIPRQVCEMLDSAGGQDEVAGILLGDKKLKQAAKQQLSIPKAETPRIAPQSAAASASEVADSLGGEEQEEAPVAAAPVKKTTATTKKESPLKSLFRKSKPAEPVLEKSTEEMETSAKKNVEARKVKPQTTDPNAPGYYPTAFDDADAPTAESTKGKPVSAIPKGW